MKTLHLAKKIHLAIEYSLIAIYYRVSISPNSPGKKFYAFGQNMSFYFLKSLDLRRAFSYFIHPVVLMRLLEFELINNKITKKEGKVLDVSSPRLFTFFLAKRFPKIQVEMFNPDKQDILETQRQAKVLGLEKRLAFKDGFKDFKQSSFDYIQSISVIEHVNTEEVPVFLKNIYMLLKPNGKLLLTFPAAKKTYDEYRENDIYGLGAKKLEDKFFYQRVHDEQTLDEQIVKVWQHLGGVMASKEVMGFDPDFEYSSYLASFRQNSLGAGLQNLKIIASKAREYPNCVALPDRGVCGVTLRKL